MSGFDVSLGLAGAVPLPTIRVVAEAAERAGLHALWLNDTPVGDSLAGLAAAAEVTTRLRLATGVIPLDRVEAAGIAARVAELGLPHDRLTLGVGSGAARHPLPLVTAGLAELASLGVPVLLGALGPRMRRLGAQRADGLLLSWLTPATVASARAQALADASAAGRAVPRVVLYARAIADPAARPELEAEAARYAGFASYAANFARLGHGAIETTVDASVDPAAAVAGYRDAVDELVFRAITVDGSTEAILRVVQAAASARG